MADNNTNGKCPFMHGELKQTGGGGTSNRDWWPNMLKLNILRQNSSLSNPMNKGFNYAEEFKSLDLDSVKKDIFNLMKDMETFHCYTTYRFWHAVSQEMIKQRVSWWTDPKIGLFNPTAAPWNSLVQAKYHLIDDKKDLLKWMTFSDLVDQGKKYVSDSLKNFFRKFRKKS